MSQANIAPNLNSTPIEPDLSDLLNLLKQEIFRDLNCHHLATIQSFNSANQTATATINYPRTIYVLDVTTQLLTPTYQNYPLLTDMPVIFPSGGSFSLTFPVQQGDQCVVLFNDRSIDNWFQSGVAGPVNSNRAHSFSDGLILVGLNSRSTPLPLLDNSRTVLRNRAGTTGVGVSSTKVKVFNATTTLNTVLQQILTQLEVLANTVANSGDPLNPAVATELALLATTLGGLIE